MERDLIGRFYEELWNRHDFSHINSILHTDVVFRGSLGNEKIGYEGFMEYVDGIHFSLGEYKCVIEEIVCESSKVFAKMLFHGVHRNMFLGFEPTNRTVAWQGAALFTICGEKISQVWVLGDLHSLEKQLRENMERTSCSVCNV